MNLTSNRIKKAPVYKSIKIRYKDFQRLKKIAYKRSQKLIDIISDLLS